MSAFEYLHIYIDIFNSYYPILEEVEDRLNEIGQKGWELVNMTPDWRRIRETEVGESHQEIAGWYCTLKRSLS